MHHPLPFQVRNASDIERAIGYAHRVQPRDRERIQRFIVRRAKDLGHTDMLPPEWRTRQEQTMPTTGNLDRQFEEKATECGISVAKLKTVYFRGVEEFNSMSLDMGTPTMWGLARVQRFINEISSSGTSSIDTDLVAVEAPTVSTNAGVEMCIDASAIIIDVLYSTGAQTAAAFAPGEVQAIQYVDDVITVDGTLDGTPWHYSLNTISGEHDLSIE